MKSICLYLHIHQPLRYKEYTIFDVAKDSDYYDMDYDARQSNHRIFNKVANKSYRPMLRLIEENINKYPNFKVSFSITGTWLEQAMKWAPELIAQIKRLVDTGQVEIVGETYYHSLAFFYDLDEFDAQVKKHAELIRNLFGVTPKVFRNTELSYNDQLAKWADANGYDAILAEGWDKVLGWRSPNHVYQPVNCNHIKLLLKNYRLSDDIAFRFSNRAWKEWPLDVRKYKHWLDMDALRGNLINLFMDFETFGEHQWEDTGIFKFMNDFIPTWLNEYENNFVTVSEAANSMPPVGTISMPNTVTWADTERDLSAWLSNSMQFTSNDLLYSLKNKIFETEDDKLINDWRHLTTSDHSYFMCTKYWNDGDVHAYFSAYASPYDAFMYFINVIRDIEYRIETKNQPIETLSKA